MKFYICFIFLLLVGCRSSTVYTSDLKSECKTDNKDYACFELGNGLHCNLFVLNRKPFNSFDVYLMLNGDDTFYVKNVKMNLFHEGQNITKGKFLWGIWLNNDFSLGGRVDSNIVQSLKLHGNFDLVLNRSIDNFKDMPTLDVEISFDYCLRNSTSSFSKKILLTPHRRIRLLSYPNDFRGH